MVATFAQNCVFAQPQPPILPAACPAPVGTDQKGLSVGRQSPTTKERADLINRFLTASANDEDVSGYVFMPRKESDVASCKSAVRELSKAPNCNIAEFYQQQDDKVRVSWVCSGWINYTMWFLVNSTNESLLEIYGSARPPPVSLPPVASKTVCDEIPANAPELIILRLKDSGWKVTTDDTRSPTFRVIKFEKDQVNITLGYQSGGMCRIASITALKDGKPIFNPNDAPELKAYLDGVLAAAMN